MKYLQDIPAWIVLLFIFVILVSLWHLRPDADTQSMMKEVLAALLFSMRATPPSTPVIPPLIEPPAK